MGIAQALQLREQPGRQPLQTLIDDVRERHLLLVLDNFEHLMEGAETVGTLLDAAPCLTVHATSRIPLHIAGEREFPVPPLDLPDGGDLGTQRSSASRMPSACSSSARPRYVLACG